MMTNVNDSQTCFFSDSFLDNSTNHCTPMKVSKQDPSAMFAWDVRDMPGVGLSSMHAATGVRAGW